MPKLLQINVTCNQGSTGKIAEQVGTTLLSFGWEVYLAHGARYKNSSQLITYQTQSVIGEYVHALESLLLDADGLGSRNATRNLIEYIKKVQPDIVQIHNLHGYYINYKILFNYLNSTTIPVIMTLHDCWPFTGHCVHFLTANCNKWISGCNNCPQTHSVPRSLVLDRSIRNFNLKNDYINKNKNLHLVCVCEWIKEQVQRSMYKEHSIHLIRNGIDTKMFRPTVSKKDSKFSILAVANPWTKDKGLFDIYKLRRLLPHDQYEIILVGLTKEQIKQLPKGITGILRTNSQEELVDLYSQSHVFINPTYADTFPTTNLEALACGTPVITYRTGGSPESIDHRTGVVIEKGAIDALADSIATIRHQPLASTDCRNRVLELYDKNERYLDYKNLYDSILSR